jgi:hypothetical protein
MSEETCVWHLDNPDERIYAAVCGDKWYLPEGTPSTNTMRYCPFCGGRLVVEATCDAAKEEGEKEIK